MRTYRVTFGVRLPVIPNAATFVFRKVPGDVCDKFQEGLDALRMFMPAEVSARVVFRRELDVASKGNVKPD